MKLQNNTTLPVAERILCRVMKQSNGCWIWTGGAVKAGGGIMRARMTHKGNQAFVYRLMFELEYGAVLPPWVLACHSCDNGLCVNPEHIFLGDGSDNALDMISKGRAHFQKHPEQFSMERIQANQNRAYRNVTGLRGVYRNRQRFGARIKIRNATLYLGTFDTAQQAHEAYQFALRQQKEGK